MSIQGNPTIWTLIHFKVLDEKPRNNCYHFWSSWRVKEQHLDKIIVQSTNQSLADITTKWPIATHILQHFIKKMLLFGVFFTICDAYFTSVAIGYEFLFFKNVKKKIIPDLTEIYCGR